MKEQQQQKPTKKRTFIYFYRRILIKSNIKLTKEQKERIFKIVRIDFYNPFLGHARIVARQIFYELGSPVSKVIFHKHKILCFIKILT